MRMAAIAVALAVFGGAVIAGPNTPDGSPALSAKQLQEIMPKLDAGRASSYLKPLTDAMKQFEINTPKRQAAFLAQVAHESHELKFLEETLSNLEAYENRADLGNIKPGDGKRYKGRGPLMLTGRTNYRIAGQALKLDLENKPETMLQADVGFRVAAWYWKTQGMNELADRSDFRGITKRMHGNYKGIEARQKFYTKAKKTLGIHE